MESVRKGKQTATHGDLRVRDRAENDPRDNRHGDSDGGGVGS